MLFNIDNMFDSSKKLFTYLTRYYRYNAFLIDEVDEQLVKDLGQAIRENNRVKAVQLYLKIDKRMDEIRDEHCFNNPDLPYRCSFRNIAKDALHELKEMGLTCNDDYKYVVKILRFITTSDYYIIREYLMKRSLTMYTYWDIPIDPDDFYCGYIPIEAILDYCIKMVRVQFKN